MKFKKEWIKWILLVLVLLMAFLIFVYGDITNTIDNTISFIKSVLDGKVLNFYEVSVENGSTLYAANYNTLIYIIMAIWYLPLYPFILKTGVNVSTISVNTIITIFWGKLFILIMTCAVAYMIYKIIMLCNAKKEKATFAIFLFFSSMMTFFSVFITVQLDVVSIFFMLLGLYGYMKNNNVLFIISFIIAAPLKMFALFLALPLILLRQKNLLKAGATIVLIAIYIIIEKILFAGSATYIYALGAQSSDAIMQICGSVIDVGKPVSLFIFLYLGLLMYVYLQKGKENDNKFIIYISFAVWALFTAFNTLNAYWIILVVPFLLINITINNKHFATNVLLETIGGFAYFVYYAVCGAYPLRDILLTSRLLLPYIIPPTGVLKYKSIAEFAETLANNTAFQVIAASIFVTSMVLILILSRPSKDGEKVDEDEQKVPAWVQYSRIGIMFATMIFIIYISTMKTNPVAYTNLALDSEPGEVNLADDYVYTQPIKFEDERELKELIIKAKNARQYRDNFTLLNVEIWDTSADECIFKKSIGASIIGNDDIKINLKDTEVTNSDEYEIRISATKGVPKNQEDYTLKIYVTEELDENVGPVRVNGEEQANSLYFEIR